MKATRPHGKISRHFGGFGPATRAAVTQRAREIALINGHPPNHFTPDDLFQAKQELIGADGEPDGGSLAALTSWDEPLDAAGHAVERTESADEQDAVIALVEEGVNEAEHEQMLAGAKAHRQ